jgi:hypothetical protein
MVGPKTKNLNAWNVPIIENMLPVAQYTIYDTTAYDTTASAYGSLKKAR